MLKDCIDIFETKYRQIGDTLITDNYTLDPGTYILVDKEGQIIDQKEVEKKDFNPIGFKEFIQRDYASKLLDMNKPIDRKKVIHSNNYLSFFVKKENLQQNDKGLAKLSAEIIDNYYAILETPQKKYQGKSLELYNNLEAAINEPDITKLNFCKSWITENIFTLLEKQKIRIDKSYLKIFFRDDMDLYHKESKRYILPNIYNTTDYNIEINKQIHGLANNNMGMNAKKPYLKNKGRLKSETPYLISIDDAYLQKKFFDYLYNYANQGKTNIYFSSDESDPDKIYHYERNQGHQQNFNGYFMRIQKGKELEIRDYDLISGFSPDLDSFSIKQVIQLPKDAKSNLIYDDCSTLMDIQRVINETFFKKFLSTNFFTDPKDIKLNDFRVKEELLRCREGFFSWFFKGQAGIIKSLFPTSSLELVKNSIANGYFVKAIEQFNVRDGFISYFKGGTSMADQLIPIKEALRKKLNTGGEHSISSDMEYYFAVGQIANFYLSKNKMTKTNHSMVNPIINCKTDKKLKDLLQRLFVKYNYAIQPNRRFGNMQSMIFAYVPSGPVDTTTLIAGYLSPSLLYEKKEEQKEGEKNV